MRGVELHIKQNSGFIYNVLSLLIPFSVEKYAWHAEQSYFIYQNDINPGLISGLRLKKIIEDKRYLIDALVLMAFPNEPTTAIPKTYEEYISSNCQLVFVCYDWYYVEIYCKDEAYLHQVYSSCIQNPDIEGVQYKTDENDGRTGLRV